MDKVIRDGKVAVLISPGYGAGWSTWNRENEESEEKLLFSPEIVKLVEDGRQNEITEDLVKKLLNIEYMYTGGACDLTIVWLPVGTVFRVEEYDGFESIITNSNLTFKA